jgi:uncharacterized membrane protein YdjX (TVP38/TMEM64 family)
VPRCNGLALYAAAVAIVLLTYCAFPVSTGMVLRELTTIEAEIRENIILSYATLVLISAVLAYLAFPSMPVIYVASGYCFGPSLGTIVVLLGSGLGGLGAFLLYRKHLPLSTRQKSQQHSPLKFWLALLGLRLSPIVPAPLVAFFAASFGASAAQYVTTTMIGSAPLILFYGFVGHQGHNYVFGAPIEWWVIPGYLAIIALSTFLSALGPWRSFLKSIKQLRSDIFASARQTTGANRETANGTETQIDPREIASTSRL